MTILQVFHISPLIRLTLMLLYVALTIPLPFLAQVTEAPVSPIVLSIALAWGGLFLYVVLMEQVVVSEEGLAVTYPPRVKWIFQGILQRGWFLAWEDLESLKPRWTGQGGIVYYCVSRSQAAYLLPMRIAGFARLLNWVEAKTQIDTQDIKPLAQPWMYFILLGCTLLLLGIDLWVVINTRGLG
jgi:hypothetical protein